MSLSSNVRIVRQFESRGRGMSRGKVLEEIVAIDLHLRRIDHVRRLLPFSTEWTALEMKFRAIQMGYRKSLRG